MKIVRLIMDTRREKLTAQRIVKLFRGLKKSVKELKIVQLITKRKKLSAQQITNFLKDFFCLFCF